MGRRSVASEAEGFSTLVGWRSPGEMRPDANILEDLGADSLDVVEMVMAIEEAFEIEIGDEDAEAMRTVGDVEAYVAKLLL